MGKGGYMRGIFASSEGTRVYAEKSREKKLCGEVQAST